MNQEEFRQRIADQRLPGLLTVQMQLDRMSNDFGLVRNGTVNMLRAQNGLGPIEDTSTEYFDLSTPLVRKLRR